eukprot:CAMPEP_0194222346 /NCGR_PEP_ID=MMETSP0156-20130528/32707_1 /TAXON_ID=33649 /ORGANISM="Thalassionema nitzschioides, Strain L26-B" /LENGTH=473 /DNA_ID=CAMNT_0038953099 /DNA_START=100 /DNA_END=1521 /DNA_ORIENTATION=-
MTTSSSSNNDNFKRNPKTMDVLNFNESISPSPSLQKKNVKNNNNNMFNRSSASAHQHTATNGVLKTPLEVEIQPLLSQHANNHIPHHPDHNENSSSNSSPSKPPHNSEFSSFTKLLAAGSYAGSSIAIQLVNKITLTTYDFPSANFVALFQCVFVVVALSLAKHIFGYTHLYPRITLQSIQHMMPLPLIQVLNVGFGLFGTKAISIPMFTALRRTSVLLTLLSEMYLLRLPTPSAVIASVALLVLGAIVAAMNDLAFDGPGYWAVTASAVATTAYGVVSKIKLSGANKLSKWEILYINSLVSIPFFCTIISIQPSKSPDSDNAWQDILDFPHWTNPMFGICFALTSCLGFWLNFFILFNTQVNGPLSTTIVGTAKNVFTTYLGMMGVGGDYIFGWANFIGLNMSMGGAVWYSVTKMKEERVKQKKNAATGNGAENNNTTASSSSAATNNNNNNTSNNSDDEEVGVMNGSVGSK